MRHAYKLLNCLITPKKRRGVGICCQNGRRSSKDSKESRDTVLSSLSRVSRFLTILKMKVYMFPKSEQFPRRMSKKPSNISVSSYSKSPKVYAK